MDAFTMGKIFQDNDGDILVIWRDTDADMWVIEIKGESFMVGTEELMEIGEEIRMLCKEWED